MFAVYYSTAYVCRIRFIVYKIFRSACLTDLFLNAHLYHIILYPVFQEQDIDVPFEKGVAEG